MQKSKIRFRSAVLASLAGGVLLSGCATGQRSLIAGHKNPGTRDVFSIVAEPASFEQVAPDLIAASGNALLPGSRRLAAGGLSAELAPAEHATDAILPGPVNTAAGAASPLLAGSATTPAGLSGPLLAIGGQGAMLLGSPFNVAAPGASISLSANLDVGGGVAPATAATRLLATTVAAVAGSGQVAPIGAGATGGTAPVSPPVLHVPAGVPGTVPLPVLLDQLKAGLLGR